MNERSVTTYAAAGVDTAAADTAVQLMRESIEQTRRQEVVSEIGGFSGLFDASTLKAYRRPLLATSTDGVGTKVAIAQLLDSHDTIGFDLVGMVVDDVVVCGAEPLFLTDYIACGAVVPERIASIGKGVADACVAAGCALVGGEIAEHPGLLEPSEYDLAGATTGVVEADELLGPDRVRDGDVVLALPSSGLHANGYALVRKVLDDAGWRLDRHVDELGRSLGEELLEPTRVYAADCLAAARAADVHAMAHITGGGIATNLARVIPPHLSVDLERGTWALPAVFELVGRLGQVPGRELESTFNMGVGMFVVTDVDAADATLDLFTRRGLDAWVAGRVTSGGPPHSPGSTSAVSLVGTYPT